MTGDDSFDSDRTIIRPSPGGRRDPSPASDATVFVPPRGGAPAPGGGRTAFQPPPARAAAPNPGPAQAAAAAPAAAPAPAPAPVSTAAAGGNPLLAAASAILMLVSRVRELPAQPDVAQLRNHMLELIRGFDVRVRASGLPTDIQHHAHYVVCATVDDLVLNTPWGASSVWARQGMVGTFHSETVGGERFFDNLARLKSDPGRNAGILELMYVCLSLGFQGHMRIHQRGTAEIARQREDLFHLLRQRWNSDAQTLSPHWEGVREPPRRLSSVVPAWVTGTVAAVMIGLIYVGFSFALGTDSESLLHRLATLPGQNRVLLTRPVLPPPPPPPVPVQAQAVVLPPTPAAQITKFLEPEIKEGLVTVTESMDSVTVRLRNTGLFASGSATVAPGFLTTLERVAKALEGEKGRITVVGHTDDVPIRTVRFRSNWDLSRARAEAVGALVSKALSEPGRLKTVGKADTEPLSTEKTPAGREKNRRTDIILSTGGGS